MICFHKYSVIQQDGYQYCERCGKAKHTCKFTLIGKTNVYESSSDKLPFCFKLLYECAVCGKTKIVKY